MARRAARGSELQLSTKGTDVTAITGAQSTDLFTKTAHGFAIGDTIVFSSITGGDANVITGKRYFIHATGFTANAFSISLTPTGAVINFTVDITAATAAKYTFTKVIQLKTIGGPTIGRGSQDVSDHDSVDYKDFLADGLGDPGEVSFEGHFDPAHVSHADASGLMALAKSGNTVPWNILIRERGTLVATLAIDGFITALEPEFPSDGPMTFSGTLKVTGVPVLY